MLSGLGARRFLAVLVAVSALAVLSPLDAAAFHGYSHGTSSTYLYRYTGVSQLRNDEYVTLPWNSACDTSLSGSIAYQTMWTILDPSNLNFIEFGTAHKTCSGGRDVMWWYAFDCTNNNCYYLWHSGFVGQAQHRFFVLDQNAVPGPNQYKWDFWIDVTNVFSTQWTSTYGKYDDIGLESYAGGTKSTTNVPTYWLNQMIFTLDNQPTWYYWVPDGGTGGWSLYKTPSSDPAQMAGQYWDSSDALAGENP
jgi:hypothetical protein